MPEVESCGWLAAPHDKWGEVPVAFIEIREGSTLDREDIIAHCRQYLAGFRAQTYYFFAQIPKPRQVKCKNLSHVKRRALTGS